MILKVKKPDYLGESMWDMRHGTITVQVRILDKEWLEKFQTRQVAVQPGDSIRAKIQISNNYGYDGELLSTHYEATSIIEVIPLPNHEQKNMFDEGDISLK